MIKLQDLTPDVYYRKSRDFQFIGRLFDVVLNSVKTNADIINILPVSSVQQDQKLTDLLLLTLGFKSKHQYNLNQQKALCSVFCYLLKNKGSLESIDRACQMLLAAEGLTENYKITVDAANCNITITIPETVSDTNLLKDMLSYILPAGMTCDIYTSAIALDNSNSTFAPMDVQVLQEKGDYLQKGIVVDESNTVASAAVDTEPTWYSTVGNKPGRIANAGISDPQ